MPRSRFLDRLALIVAPRVAAALMRLTRLTMKLTHLGRERIDALARSERPYIHAFWHGHLFLMPYSYRGSGISIVISAHRDGELIARTMRRFGHEAVRGSSTSGGAAALRGAVRALRAGRDVGFTPDGPRGPRHRVQMGVVLAARMGGAPIVPVAFAASRGKVLSSWDRFVVPAPFSHGVFAYGEPIEVSPEADEEAMESARRTLEERLHELTSIAEAACAGRKVEASRMDGRHV